jgi:signal transduction histidine kinase
MRFPSKIRSAATRVLDRYGIVLAGLLIFAYYLWSAIDLFENPLPKRGFTGYLFQFDTLIVLWISLVIGAKLNEYRKKHKAEAERNKQIAMEHEKQKMRLDVLDDVTEHLSDAINNPLSIISLSTGSLRDRFSADREVAAFLDRIEGALRRMREVLIDFQQYQTRKIMKSSDPLMAPQGPGLATGVHSGPKPSGG